MKIFQYIWLIGLVIATSSCYKDLGDYDYIEPEEINVAGIQATYSVLTGLDVLKVEPEVRSTDSNAELEYNWMINEILTSGAGRVAKTDTIAKTKDLEYFVNLDAKEWVLVLSVKNLNTGYTAYTTSKLRVTTEFTRGWYVSTDDGVNSDIQLYYTSDENQLQPDGRVAHNVFSTINGKQIPGTGGAFSFFHDYKTMHESGNFSNTRVLMQVTDQEVSVIDINSFKEVRTFKDVFYNAPQEKTPLHILYTGYGIFFNNAGSGLYSIYNMMPNTGQFGTALLKDGDATPYQLSKFSIAGKTGMPIFFDELSSSFVAAPVYGSNLIKPGDSKYTHMSATNTGKELLYMQASSSYPLRGYAVLQDIEDPSMRILSQIYNTSTRYFRIYNDTIPSTDKFYKAELFGQNFDDEDLIYFCSDNEVWSRSLLNGHEQLQYQVPAGEKVVLISHKKVSTIGLNYVVVATQKGNEFTVRMFTKQAGNLSVDPQIVISGEGNFSDIMYISPKIETGSYCYSSPWSK